MLRSDSLCGHILEGIEITMKKGAISQSFDVGMRL